MLVARVQVVWHAVLVIVIVPCDRDLDLAWQPDKADIPDRRSLPIIQGPRTNAHPVFDTDPDPALDPDLPSTCAGFQTRAPVNHPL